MRTHVQVHTSTTEMQRVFASGNFALDFASLVKVGDQYIDAMSKVCDGLRGDAVVAAQEVGFDNLHEIVNGTPRGIDTLINHMRGMIFPFDRTCISRIIPPVLSPWRTFVQTKWRKYETVCLATTTLLDTSGSDGSGNSPQ